jgi:hypothetical protein
VAPSKNPNASPPRGEPSVTPEIGIKLLSEQINKAREIVELATPVSAQLAAARLAAALPVNGNDFDRWKNTTRNYVMPSTMA